MLVSALPCLDRPDRPDRPFASFVSECVEAIGVLLADAFFNDAVCDLLNQGKDKADIVRSLVKRLLEGIENCHALEVMELLPTNNSDEIKEVLARIQMVVSALGALLDFDGEELGNIEDVVKLKSTSQNHHMETTMRALLNGGGFFSSLADDLSKTAATSMLARPTLEKLLEQFSEGMDLDSLQTCVDQLPTLRKQLRQGATDKLGLLLLKELKKQVHQIKIPYGANRLQGSYGDPMKQLTRLLELLESLEALCRSVGQLTQVMCILPSAAKQEPDTEPMIPQMYGQNVGSRHLQVLMQGLELFTTEGVPDALHKLHEYRKQAKTQLGVNGFVEALQAAILPQDASSEKFASLDILTLSKLFDDMGGFPANVPESEDIKVVATKALPSLLRCLKERVSCPSSKFS